MGVYGDRDTMNAESLFQATTVSTFLIYPTEKNTHRDMFVYSSGDCGVASIHFL